MIIVISSVSIFYVYYNQKKIAFNEKQSSTEVSKTRISKVPDKVLDLIEEPKELEHKFGVDKEEHNVAEEDKDEPEDDEKLVALGDGGDSNDAEEDNNDMDLKMLKPLPPSDGSIKFKGPQNERQRAVVASFQHAWQGYRTYAWGKDHLKPISKSHQTW